MKILKIKNILLLFIFTVLLTVQELMAANKPPAPRGNGGFDEEWTVGASIDGFIPYIIVVGLAFGIWGLQKQFLISKIK